MYDKMDKMDKDIIRMQMLAGIITEGEYKDKLNEESFMSGMKWIKNLTPEIKEKIDQLQKDYPDHKFSIVSNDKWRPDREDLKGTYTLSYSGPNDDVLNSIMDKELKNI